MQTRVSWGVQHHDQLTTPSPPPFQVRGDIHHERRLHHLLLLEELRSWELQQQQQQLQAQAARENDSLSAIEDAASVTGGVPTASMPTLAVQPPAPRPRR